MAIDVSNTNLAGAIYPSMQPAQPVPPGAKEGIEATLYPTMAKKPAEKAQQERSPSKGLYPSMEGKTDEKVDAKTDEKTDEKTDAGKTDARTPQEIEVAAAKLTEDLELDPNDARVAPFTKVAAELGLDAAGAEKLAKVDLETRTAFWAGQSAEWAEASTAEFSTEDLTSARTAVQKFGDADLWELLSGPLGLGNHPAVVRAFAKAGRAAR